MYVILFTLFLINTAGGEQKVFCPFIVLANFCLRIYILKLIFDKQITYLGPWIKYIYTSNKYI